MSNPEVPVSTLCCLFSACATVLSLQGWKRKQTIKNKYTEINKIRVKVNSVQLKDLSFLPFHAPSLLLKEIWNIISTIRTHCVRLCVEKTLGRER